MKKPFFQLAVAFAVAAVSSAFVVSPIFAQPPTSNAPQTPKLSEERVAELNRPLVPRGEKIGLLIAFHGAQTPTWSELTDSLVEKVRQLNVETPVFAAVEGAQMEFSPENDVVAAFGRLENAGCDAVVAVPAFVYPTGHTQFDVVSILGVYSSVKMRETLKEEGIRTVRSKIPTTVAPTFGDGDLLKNFVVSEAKSIAKDPKNERVLVFAHGDENFAGLVDSQTADALNACRELGFDDVRSAFCEMGQSFGKNVRPILEKNTKDGKKTLLIAIYLASSAKSFVERLERSPASERRSDDSSAPNANSLNGLNYECSQGRLGDFEETPTWIFDAARAASVF